MAGGAPGDPYVYPGTEVLRNRLGLRDAAALRLAEYAYTTRRAGEAPRFPPTAAGYLALHRHLFADLYDWAGTLRTVDVGKGDSIFAAARFLPSNLERRFRDLAAAGWLREPDIGRFAAGAAHHLSELNALHPFRDGNGRAMRLHLAQLAEIAGHRLDLARVPAGEWMAASIEGFRTADAGRMARLIAGALGPALPDPVAPPGPDVALSPDAGLLQRALDAKIDAEAKGLSAAERRELKAFAAAELVAKERRDGPVALTPAQRQVATVQAALRDQDRNEPRKRRR